MFCSEFVVIRWFCCAFGCSCYRPFSPGSCFEFFLSSLCNDLHDPVQPFSILFFVVSIWNIDTCYWPFARHPALRTLLAHVGTYLVRSHFNLSVNHTSPCWGACCRSREGLLFPRICFGHCYDTRELHPRASRRQTLVLRQAALFAPTTANPLGCISLQGVM